MLPALHDDFIGLNESCHLAIVMDFFRAKIVRCSMSVDRTTMFWHKVQKSVFDYTKYFIIGRANIHLGGIIV